MNSQSQYQTLLPVLILRKKISVNIYFGSKQNLSLYFTISPEANRFEEYNIN